MGSRRLNRSFIARLGRRARYYYLRLLLVPDTPSRVARGLAVGVFIGFLPIIPFQTMAAIALAWVFRGSFVASAMGTWVTNPVTVPPLYALFFLLGKTLTPFGRNVHVPDHVNINNILDLGSEMALAALIGGMVIGLLAMPLVYVLSFKYLDKLQAYERRKLREKFTLPPPDAG